MRRDQRCQGPSRLLGPAHRNRGGIGVTQARGFRFLEAGERACGDRQRDVNRRGECTAVARSFLAALRAKAVFRREGRRPTWAMTAPRALIAVGVPAVSDRISDRRQGPAGAAAGSPEPRRAPAGDQRRPNWRGFMVAPAPSVPTCWMQRRRSSRRIARATSRFTPPPTSPNSLPSFAEPVLPPTGHLGQHQLLHNAAAPIAVMVSGRIVLMSITSLPASLALSMPFGPW